VPPLRYDVVHRLKREFPALTIVINGGLSDWSAIERELTQADGVMLGRLAYHDPFCLAELDRVFTLYKMAPQRGKKKVDPLLLH